VKVVQIIDSLDAGGAERMAVNYANGLAGQIAFSGLIATRRGGVLKQQIQSNVHFLCLQKKSAFDYKAVFRLRKFLSINKIDVIHVHGSSFFIGLLVKIIYFKVKLIWHDHYGDRIKNTLSNNWYIKVASLFFDGVIACNNELLDWSNKNLFTSHTVYLPNFTNASDPTLSQTVLKGIEGKRIVCLSNLRAPKNHKVLLKGFLNSEVFEKGWTLHLIGKENNDDYSNEIRSFVKDKNLEQAVFFYGVQNDIHAILSQASIGVLTSTFEGFPVVLLEYGQAGLAVISTNVGQCPEIILDERNGSLFHPESTEELSATLIRLTEDETLRIFYSSNLKAYVYENFSSRKIIQKALDFYKSA
jgi:glycosyltransferase involved in cell wall biosynthesis